MSIMFTDGHQFLADVAPWSNQPTASLAFLFRYEEKGLLSPAVLNTNYIIQGGSFYIYTQATSMPGTMQLVFNVRNFAGSLAQVAVTVNVGTTYYFEIIYTSGQQILKINGIPQVFGTKTGNTYTSTLPVSFGVTGMHGTLGLIYTIGKFAIWDGYALSDTDSIGLRDGTLMVSDVGISASRRLCWTMYGTINTTVSLGDSGLANDYGDHTYDLKHVTGTGSTIYVPNLIFEPAANAISRVASSGKSIVTSFTSVIGNATTIPLQAFVVPTVIVNGVNKGSLVNRMCSGHHKELYYGLPNNLIITPSDVVMLTAPTGWVNTAVGITGAMNNQIIENCAGRSAYGIDDLIHTHCVGTNTAHLGSQAGGVYTLTKNWVYRSSAFSGATAWDTNGKPIAGNVIEIVATLHDVHPQTNLDNTFTFPSGLYAVRWNDTNVPFPTLARLLTSSSLTLSIIERKDMNNPGINGVGIVRVFEVTQIATVPQAAYNSSCVLQLGISNDTKKFYFNNLVVYGPGDFAATSGVPTILDVSDPTAISNTYKDRLAGGCGSMRFIDSLFGYGGEDQVSEAEHVLRISDFTWGAARQKAIIPCTMIRPWDPTVTPYIYSTLFGSPYDVILTAPILDATTTTITISPDPINPIMIGLQLKIDDELIRILNVADSTVTVERGSCGTTATTHAAGIIQAQNRWNASVGIPAGIIYEIVTAIPHGYHFGPGLGGSGPWPSLMTMTDGSKTSGAQMFCASGPNTLLGFVNTSQKPHVTLAAPITLNSACILYANTPNAPAIPIEFAAKLAANFSNCILHFSLPHYTSDSLAWQAWEWILKYYPDGRFINFEHTNEPWNGAFPQFTPLNMFSAWLYPPNAIGWEWYVRRITELVTIGRKVWSRAGRDPALIRSLINVMTNDTTKVSLQLEFAKSLGVPINLVATSDYFDLDSSPAMQSAYWNIDDDQAVDLVTLDLRTKINGYTAIFAAMNSTIAAYNAKYNESVKLYIYEGGISVAAPQFNAIVSGTIDAITTTVTLGPSAWASSLVVGTPLLCESEWMTVAAPSPGSNALIVARGAFGSIASSHPNGVGIRTAWVERSHDLVLNPNWESFENELCAMEQEANVAGANRYSMSMGSAQFGTNFGMYKVQNQQPGTGRGDDGKFDNRLTLCTPGKLYSKEADVPQDLCTNSIRGNQFIKWNRSIKNKI